VQSGEDLSLGRFDVFDEGAKLQFTCVILCLATVKDKLLENVARRSQNYCGMLTLLRGCDGI
jgi:hypothetical protein